MDVGGWLRGLGLGQYEEKFRDNKIDADLLPRLTVDDLKDIGVSVVGDRRRLLDAIAVIAGAGPPADVPASPTKTAPSEGLEASAERRPITVMFCDLVGSTSLAAKLDAEDWRTLVNAYLDEASKAVTDFGGHVLKKLGDGLMALFGYPQAQENDAERAVRAALAIQRGLADLNARNARSGAPQLSARIGIECGSVVVDAAGEVFGEAPNVAARVQAAAEPGSVLITASVQRQTAGLFVVEDKGAYDLKGVAAPVALYRVVRASGGGRRGAGHALTPLVGREDELALLTRRWSRALEGEGQFVQIVGEPGIGKSRLIEEFRAKLAETPHTWVEWAASQLLQNTPLHPLAEWGRLRFGGADTTDEGRLADLENTLRLVGLDPDEYAPLIAPLVDIPLPEERSTKFAPEELRRRQLVAVTAWYFAGARTQPAVLVFEDLHWVDPTSLDLMRSLVERGVQAPLFIVATTRPEFRPPWAMRSHHGVISLAPLDRAQVRRMVGENACRHALSDEMIDGVGERSGGVPLFVEEVTRLLLERDAQGGAQAIPPTLQQSLAARLGEAREVAQIGAVLGRDFSYRLLSDVSSTAAGFDELRLQAALDRLMEADLLFVDGAPPTAAYRFKHALIQDAAYESLLKSRRQALHRRAAEALRDSDQRAAAEPEVVAHHFTQAGLDELAIEWWGKAGDQALRRSAFQEAIAHLGKAIAMADEAEGHGRQRRNGDAPDSSNRLKLQNDYGKAVMWSKGFAAEEAKVAFSHAVDLAATTDDFSERFAAGYGRWAAHLIAGECRQAEHLASRLVQEAEIANRERETARARIALGSTCFFEGKLSEAKSIFERVLAGWRPAGDDLPPLQVWTGRHVFTACYLANVAWLWGEAEYARRLSDEAIRRASELRHAQTSAQAHTARSFLEIFRDDPAAALRSAELTIATAREHGMQFYAAAAEIHSTWARSRLPSSQVETAELRRVISEYVKLGNRNALPLYLGLLAERELDGRAIDAALATIDEALMSATETGQRLCDAFLYRLRGDVLSNHTPADPALAEEAYRTAITIAKQQGARSFGLQAAQKLAKLYQSTSRLAEAHAVLAPALEGFATTPEMPEIAEAQALLTALAATDEVKADAARRQRLTHLQVAYGNALIAARGHGAPETTEAFAKARETVLGDRDAPERLAADWGLWAGSFVRGELPSMRAHAGAFLSDAEASSDSPEAGVAHRTAGLTCWFAGEYRQARNHLERALVLFEPGRDDDLAFRFGVDPGVNAMAFLAIASWALGEVDRAVSLIDRMQTRIATLTHVGTLAQGRNHTAMFELMRGDHPRAAQNAFELARLTREYDLNLWGAFGVFLQGWTASHSGAPADGLEDMRRGVEQLREQNVLFFDGLLKIALAEAEARAGDPDRALVLLDEALATSERTGHRSFEAELHRARGDVLRMRDPANPVLAEEAFLTAIAIAKQQGTRSFELRAALKLAKHYHSTGRAAEAHAMLAPALEGFSPTPEMLEIAEAQALLAALAQTEEVKAAEAQRQRRLHLQTQYGQAMMWAKGFAAEETRAAFSRATDLAANSGNFAARFAAGHGQWVTAVTLGEQRRARELASAFLKEAEDAGRVSEAGVARRGLAVACYLSGDFLEARIHCERALATCDPEREKETRERFTDDTGPVVMSVLAMTMWQLGEVERARELIDEVNQRARDVGHAPSMAHPLNWTSRLEILRGDAAAALSAAEELEALCREHGMPLWRVNAELKAGWARGRIHDAAAGAEDLRRALAAAADLGMMRDAWFYTALLAELEAQTLGADSALARIDEALVLAHQVDDRCDLPFPHLLRGELLLKRNPSNPAPAEEALHAALEIAKQQGARSWGLRAALSLAKLYRSTSRLAEGQAVLAPALEGFSPTPEMPEVAEAQALLMAIEAGAHARHE